MANPNNYRNSKETDPRSTKELVELALSEEDEELAWQLVSVLHYRATREVFESAKILCQSQNAKERILGINILGQLGIPDRAFTDESLPILFTLLEREQDEKVLSSIGVALGHIGDVKAVKPLANMKNHPSEEVRFGVAFGLLGHTEDLAIDVLIELSNDEDEEVRNWATFGLGSLIDVDNNGIREALFNRLSENNSEIRGEAFVGLAIRGDKRIIELLLQELSSEEVGVLAIEAAKEIKDPRLHSVLIGLKDWWDVDKDLLDEAIQNCSNR